MLPALTERAGVRIEQSVGLLDGSDRLARLLGATVAGLLVAIVGPVASLFVNAATFALSALLTWAFVPVYPAVRQEESDAPTSYWSDLAAGFRFVVRDPLMRLIVGLVLVTNLFDAARSSSMVPL